MHRHDKALLREGRFLRYEKESPSFSSTLLEKIYRSIDNDGDKITGDDFRFRREATTKKQSRGIARAKKFEEEEEEEEDDEETSSFRRTCLVEKWMDRKASERQQNRHYSESERKYNDANESLFFSSTSSSSDSSSGGFSSSDTESIFGATRPRPVRTSALERKPSQIKIASRNDDGDESLIKSKSRALKIYNNLKKVKQPISPGGKLASFINSLFKASSGGGGAKASTAATQRATACSSASSFSRSCLSKRSPSTRERLGEPKRSVRFYPVSVIVDEDSRPCGHKSLREDRRPVIMPVSVPTAWKIGRSPATKTESGVQDAAREFLRQNQLRNERLIMRDQFRAKDNVVRANKDVKLREDFDDDDDDGSASCSSSDLFELDHLAVGFQEELPVYETTRVDRNRAIF